MYESLLLIDEDSDLPLAAFADAIRTSLSGSTDGLPRINTSEHEILVNWPSFALTLCKEDEPHVAEESAELAGRYARNHPDRERIARCQRRYSVSADPDPDMDHFNDYVFVCNAAEKLARVYVFDSQSGEFV